MKISSEYVSEDYLRLNSCGIQNLGNVDVDIFRQNGRKDYYLLYIQQGRCYIDYDSETVCVNEGNLILFRPGITQKYRFYKGDNSISCYIHFTGTECDRLLSQIGMHHENIVYIGKSPAIKELYRKMSAEYILKKNFYENMCKAYLTEFFALIARRLTETKTNVNSQIDKICVAMHETYSLNYPVGYYADLCNLSVSRFSHVFKEITGSAPLEYLMHTRIRYSKELLLKTSLSISEIAELTGFSNQNYFARMFKKFTGYSPTKYVKSI